MQVRSWKVHILNLTASIEQIQNIGKLLCMLGLNSSLSAMEKELLKPFVPEAFYHLTNV